MGQINRALDVRRDYLRRKWLRLPVKAQAKKEVKKNACAPATERSVFKLEEPPAFRDCNDLLGVIDKALQRVQRGLLGEPFHAAQANFKPEFKVDCVFKWRRQNGVPEKFLAIMQKSRPV